MQKTPITLPKTQSRQVFRHLHLQLRHTPKPQAINHKIASQMLLRLFRRAYDASSHPNSLLPNQCQCPTTSEIHDTYWEQEQKVREHWFLQCWIELYPAVIYTTEQLSLCNVIPVKLRDQSHLWTQQDPAAVSVKWSCVSSVGWYCKTAISSLVGSNGRHQDSFSL